jgi:hypothetical protein
MTGPSNQKASSGAAVFRMAKMNTSAWIAAIDQEIASLEQARRLLSGGSVPSNPRRTTVSVKKASSKKRIMSAEGRARIAEAQRQRWANRKKAAK